MDPLTHPQPGKDFSAQHPQILLMGNIFPFENNHGNFNLKATKHIIYIIWGKFHWAKQGFIEAVRLNKTNTRKGSQNLIIFLELAFPFFSKISKGISLFFLLEIFLQPAAQDILLE